MHVQITYSPQIHALMQTDEIDRRYHAAYLQTIKLGGQKEKLYNETNIYEMKLAMRRAGRIRAND